MKSIVYALRHAIQQHERSIAERETQVGDSIINFIEGTNVDVLRDIISCVI